MIRIATVASFLLVAPAVALRAQDSAVAKFRFSPEIEAGGGLLRYYGDVGYDQLNEPYKTKLGYRLSVHQGLSPDLDIGLYFLSGHLSANEKSVDRNLNFRTSFFSSGLIFTYTFAGLLPENRKVTPFLQAGIEYMKFRPKGDLTDAGGRTYHYWLDGTIRDIDEGDPDAGNSVVLSRDYEYESDLRDMNLDGFGRYPLVSLSVPAGAGVRLHLSKTVSMRAGVEMHYTFSDYLDNVTEAGGEGRGGRGGNDRFVFSYVTLSYDFGPEKTADEHIAETIDFLALEAGDEDGDGVKDLDDLCQGTPGGVGVDEKGCPLDDDRDGIANHLDEEPMTAPDTVVNTRGELMTDTMILDIFMAYMDSTGAYGFDPDRHIRRQIYEYRILVGTFDENLPSEMMDAFMSIEGLKSDKTPEGKTILSIGSFPTPEQAEVRRLEIEKEGIKDTRVIQWQPEYSRKVTIDQSTVDKLMEAAASDVAAPVYSERVLYRVQLGAFSQEPPPGTFLGISDISAIVTENNVVKYMAGNFSIYRDAARHKIDMIVRGFSGAFVVAYKDGKRIDISEAVAAEKAYAKPPASADTAGVKAVTPAGGMDPGLAEKTKEGLVFKVEIGVFGDDVPVDVLSKLVEIGDVGKEVLAGEGKTRYTSGSFSDYASAEKHLAEVKAKGLAGATVVPVFGGKVISLAEAVELLK